MNDDPDLNAAYGLEGPEGSKVLYAKWAQTYDSSFAQDMHYRAPAVIAARYAELSGRGPVLDLGAGTGLVGQALHALGIIAVHGTDISPEMLVQATKKGIYAHLFEGDLTARLDVTDGTYAGVVSAGTFTNGHVGPEAFHEVIRCMASGAWAVISVNAIHWDALGFDVALEQLAQKIVEQRKEPFALYGDGASGPHADDEGWLLQLRKL